MSRGESLLGEHQVPAGVSGTSKAERLEEEGERRSLYPNHKVIRSNKKALTVIEDNGNVAYLNSTEVPMETRKDVHPALQQTKKFINLRDIPPELHRAIKVKAAAKDMSMQDFIIDLLTREVLQ